MNHRWAIRAAEPKAIDLLVNMPGFPEVYISTALRVRGRMWDRVWFEGGAGVEVKGPIK